jgi:large subunit ribosomal protein L32
MAVPKRRTSKTRKGKRRSHKALKVKSLALCPKCGSPMLPHRACPECGFYKGRQVIEGAQD